MQCWLRTFLVSEVRRRVVKLNDLVVVFSIFAGLPVDWVDLQSIARISLSSGHRCHRSDSIWKIATGIEKMLVHLKWSI